MKRHKFCQSGRSHFKRTILWKIVSYASSDHETLCRSSCIACRQKVSRLCVKTCDTSYYCSDCKNSCTVYKQRAFLQCEWACESSDFKIEWKNIHTAYNWKASLSWMDSHANHIIMFCSNQGSPPLANYLNQLIYSSFAPHRPGDFDPCLAPPQPQRFWPLPHPTPPQRKKNLPRPSLVGTRKSQNFTSLPMTPGQHQQGLSQLKKVPSFPTRPGIPHLVAPKTGHCPPNLPQIWCCLYQLQPSTTEHFRLCWM